MLPRFRGLHWWGAVLVATVATAVGAGLDAKMHGALGSVYQVLYLTGCVGAALAVRRRALFTAAVQPPLVAFLVSVVTLYFLNSDMKMSAKTLVFKVALPIASSFPSMAVTFVITLAVVIGRWFITRGAVDSDPVSQLLAKVLRRPAASESKADSRSRGTRRADRSRSVESAGTRRRAAAPTDAAQPGTRAQRRQPTNRRQTSQREQSAPRSSERPTERPRPAERTERRETTERRRSAPAPTSTRQTAGAAARAAGLDLSAGPGDPAAARRRRVPPSAPREG